MAKIKRIFLTGSAGSFWSTVNNHLRWGLGELNDNSDITSNRSWNGHTGAYHNPGNEPGFDWILKFGEYDRAEIERMLDSAFTESVSEDKEYIVRIHKSHLFSLHLEHIEKLFPEADIIASVQEPHKSLLWWGLAGGVDTVFDNYDYYERDVESIWKTIVEHNEACENWIEKNNLAKEYLNLDWLKKYYGEPSYIFERYSKRFPRNPDGIDNAYGKTTLMKNLSNTAFAAMKQGTMRINQ
jgi:hypothetical protein